MVRGETTSAPATFVALPIVPAIVAIVASLVPAPCATRVDPIAALSVD